MYDHWKYIWNCNTKIELKVKEDLIIDNNNINTAVNIVNVYVCVWVCVWGYLYVCVYVCVCVPSMHTWAAHTYATSSVQNVICQG